MTPSQKLKHKILTLAVKPEEIEKMGEINADNIDDLYDEMESSFEWDQDAVYGFRNGEVETEVECDYSRHYESMSVGATMLDGSWVGWTYWYGGGKHGEPEAVDWIEHAYDLTMTEEEKMIVVQTFVKNN